jgi:hypothetical protein
VMAMKEMLGYKDGVNVDRLVALAALIAFVKIQESNSKPTERIENDINNDLDNSQNLYKLKHNPYRNIGKSNVKSMSKLKRSGFKNLW